MTAMTVMFSGSGSAGDHVIAALHPASHKAKDEVGEALEWLTSQLTPQLGEASSAMWALV